MSKVFNSVSPQRGDSNATLLEKLVQKLGGQPEWGDSLNETLKKILLAFDPAFAGVVSWGGISGALSSQADLQAALNLYVLKAGDTMSGSLVINGQLVTTSRRKHIKQVVGTYTLDTTTLDEVVVCNSATPFALTLTNATLAANLGRSVIFKNKGAGAVTLTSATGSQIFATSAAATLVLATGDSVTLISDQVVWLVT